MHVAKRIALALLLLPAAEIVVFLMLVAWIGFLKTVLLMIATSCLGALVLQRAGGTNVAHFRTEFGRAEVRTTQVDGAGVFTVLGGILLLLPGFITDVLGFLLLVPMVQQRIGNRIMGFFRTTATRQDGVIDLPPDEWHRHPDRKVRTRKPRSLPH